MKIANIDLIRRLKSLTDEAEKDNDNFIKFVLAGQPDYLRLQRENLSLFFAECRRYGLRYISIDRRQIAGCEGITQDGSPWPVVWQIPKNIGMVSKGGNSDQAFVDDISIIFPQYALGHWSLSPEEKLTIDDVKQLNLKFRIV